MSRESKVKRVIDTATQTRLSAGSFFFSFFFHASHLLRLRTHNTGE